MSPCSPTDVSFPTPTGPSGPPIPGVGTPFALPFPNISPFPTGFPEDLLDIFNKLQMLIPPGAIKPQLNPNFGKDIFDAIMKMLDQFFPFLMLYKFFLPVLNLIVCIIEVLCALMNPFALISAINRLFSQCIPEFLNLFPIFALIIMIISLLLLLVALIEYIINQILKFIKDILRNINALIKAYEDADSNAVLAIAMKLGSLLCVFQNLFVLLAVFNVIIEIIRDMLGLAFSIPPCENSQSGSTNGCCSTLTCPSIVQSDYTNNTGTLQYLPQVELINTSFLGFSQNLRGESWQLFDNSQTQAQAFSNIYNAYDIPSNINPKPIFFPTDANYTATTAPNQASYTIDLRLFYNPTNWNRFDVKGPRYIRFTNCIVLEVPSSTLINFDNSLSQIPNAVLSLAGGLGYEDDGTTVLTGYAADGTTAISNQATLQNFIHNRPVETFSGGNLPNDGYSFLDATYTFKPNMQVLLGKQIVTLGCEPGVTLNRQFVNTVMYSNVGTLTLELNGLLNGGNFPDPNATMQCLQTAVSGLRSNLSAEGAAIFQATALTCLSNLQNDTNNALASMVGIGFSPCNSSFTFNADTQFTSQPITVSVNLAEKNGINLTQGFPTAVAEQIAVNIKPYITFGKITPFSYDGYQLFTAQISSDTPGSGNIMISFENQILCTDTVSSDTSVAPSHTLQSLPYQFIYTPTTGTIPLPSVGEDGGTDTGFLPRRNPGDVGREGDS